MSKNKPIVEDKEMIRELFEDKIINV